MKEKILTKRVKIFFVFVLLCEVLLFGGFLLCVNRGETVGMIVYTAVFLLTIAVTGIFYWLYLYLPAKRLSEEERKYSSESLNDAVYRPEYLWSESYFSVLEHYQNMLDRKELMQLMVKSSQYLALQKQINPHFLYNTLDAIRSDMLISGNDQIADMVEALSKYFSYAVSNMEQMASISEELGNVMDYFTIQKYRFEDRISLNVVNEIGDRGVNEFCIPRMTLQPLVENAIVHGLESLGKGGMITIRLMQVGDCLKIHVIDNGVGMDTLRLRQLNARLKKVLERETLSEKRRGGIALDNVNSRIKLMFGDDYGMMIFSEVNVGTDISLLLPCLTEKGK